MLFWKKKKPSPPPQPPSEEPSTPEKKTPAEGVLSVRSRPSSAIVSPPKPSQFPRKRGFVSPYLTAIRSALHAETVLFLRFHAETETYYIDEVAGQRTHVALSDNFKLPPFLETLREKPEVRTFSSTDFSDAGIPYTESSITVPVILIAPVALPEGMGFLLADRKHMDTPFSRHEHYLLEEMARLLGLVLREEEPPEPPSRSRRAILQEEMERAAEKGPVTLTLIYPREAHRLSLLGGEEVAKAERTMQEQLQAWFPDLRVEKFGELMMGIFFYGTDEEAAAWMNELDQRFSELEGPLGEGVFIGAAQLTSTHRTPDAWRNDARQALLEAYESGAITYFVEEA